MNKHKIIFIVIFSFALSILFQWIRWDKLSFFDAQMWVDQAQYFETEDSRQFDRLLAYGHPGGPIIEGVMFIHKLNYSYEDALIIFITLFNSLIISSVCVLCVILRKNNFWWVTSLSVLGFSSMYSFSTPPSALVSPLVVLLCLFTLYLYENKDKIKELHLVIFSLIVGLTISMRTDIGIFCTLFFVAFLIYEKVINWKKVLSIFFISFFFFTLFDPFMWTMSPLQHVKDLISKIVFHYAEFTPNHMTFISILDISFLTFIGVFFTSLLVLFRKKINSILPVSFSVMLIFMTFIIYVIFLTSHYQAARYFQPIIFIWEVFLPLIVLDFISKIYFNFPGYNLREIRAQKMISAFFVFIFVFHQISLFYIDFMVNKY